MVSLIFAAYAVFCALRVGLYAQWMESGLEQWLSRYKLVGQIGNVSDGLAYVVLAALLVTAYRRAAVSRDRTMLQWLIAGMLLSLPPYFFFDQLPLIIGGTTVRVGLGSIAQLFLTILPVFLLIGLSGHRAFNFRFFMSRYALYATLFIVMIALFAVVYPPLKSALETGYTVGSPLPELFAAGFILLALALLRILLEWAITKKIRNAPRVLSESPRAGIGPFAQTMGDSLVPRPQTQKLEEVRALMRGIVGALREPARRLTAELSQNGTREQQEAGARVTEFLHALDALAGPPSTIRGSSTAQAVVRRAAEQIRGRFSGVEIQLSGGSPALLSCYPEELVQAVCCILENAAEARVTSSHAIVVKVVSESAWVCIEISDSGSGIDTRAQRKLFNPFFTTKPGHQGIGLYFARLIVERNEGTIEVGRNETGGTRVRLAFPREHSAGMVARGTS
jgi:signal transduction histidine kinase